MENQSNQGVLCGGKWITPQNIKQQFGKSREDAAATFKVSVSTFTRKYKKLGINQWPYPQRKSSRRNEETSQLLQMEETSSASGHQRKNQNSDIPIRQAIEGNNMPSSIIDPPPPPPMGAQPCLESTSTQTSNPVSSAKLTFSNLIALPLEHLSNPEKETSMREALSVLKNNLSLFSSGQAEQVLKLFVEFPVFVLGWREYSRSHKYSQKSSGETENLVENSKKDEGSFKARCEEVENKEEKLKRQLEAVKKEKTEIAEKRTDKSKQTKDLLEKEALQKRLERKATGKLENLSEQWAKQQSFLVKLN